MIPDEPDSRKSRFLAGAEVWAWLLLPAALLRVYLYISETLASAGSGLWFFFSSDTVQYGLIYRDLFEDEFHLSGWNISHAPEYVQMVVALLCRGITGSLASGQVLEAMVQPVLLALSLRFAISRLWPGAAALGPSLVGALLILIARGQGLDAIAFVWSNRHGYTAILSVLGLGLLLETLRKSRRALPLALVVIAGMASDLLFAVWFVAPALASVIVLQSSIPAGRARPALRWMMGGAAIGLAAFWALTPAITVGSKTRIQPAATWDALNRIFDDAFKSSPLHTVAALITVAGFLVAFAAAVRPGAAGRRVAGLFVATMGASTILAVAATAAPFREAGYTRYLLAPELAGLVVLIGAAVQAAGRWGSGLLPALLTVLLLPGPHGLPPRVPPATAFYPPLVECLDAAARRHRLSYGVADYWLAKYVTAFSRTGLRVVAVTPRLDPFVDFSNIEWFLGGVGARRHDRPQYTFAILGSSRPESQGVSPVALQALGPPLAVENCHGFEIRVLPPGADDRIRAQFKQSPRIKGYYEGRGLPLP